MTDATKMWKRVLLALPLAALLAQGAHAETVARYGISLADIPLTTGQPDRGAGAYQFTGHTIYDPLIAWEANISTRPGKLIPGLATEWKVDPKDSKVWRFTLRKGVKFHDGSDFKADAVVWNLDKVLNDKSPQFDAKQSAQVRPRIPSIASFRKVDDYTVEITTKDVDALFPYQLPWFLIGSPAQWDKLGRDWAKVAMQPSGTGPFSSTSSCRASAPSSSRTRPIGTRRASEDGPHRPHSDPRCRDARQRAAQWAGRLDRNAAARHAAAARVAQVPHRPERDAARLAVSLQHAARLAVDRHPREEGRESRDRPRRHRQAARRPGRRGQGPARSE